MVSKSNIKISSRLQTRRSYYDCVTLCFNLRRRWKQPFPPFLKLTTAPTHPHNYFVVEKKNDLSLAVVLVHTKPTGFTKVLGILRGEGASDEVSSPLAQYCIAPAYTGYTQGLGSPESRKKFIKGRQEFADSSEQRHTESSPDPFGY